MESESFGFPDPGQRFRELRISGPGAQSFNRKTQACTLSPKLLNAKLPNPKPYKTEAQSS